MSTRRNRYYALDQRTGRLERAINLVNDGQVQSLRVAATEADRYNPQSRPTRVPLDRVSVNGTSWVVEPVRGPTDVQVGFWSGSSSGSNWERPGMPAMTMRASGGFASTSGGIYGFGNYGFGNFGFGGSFADEEIDF